jgi:hypothetical protein
MRQAPAYRAIDPACSRVGRATQATAAFLAVLWVFLASAFAAFIPGSPTGMRVEYLFFIGLIPAVGLYVCGHILRLVFGLGCKFCEIVATYCVRRLGLVGLAKWASEPVSGALDRCAMIIARCRLTTGQWMENVLGLLCGLIWRWGWHVHRALFDLSCLLIRNTARLVIRIQHAGRYWRVRDSIFDFSCLLIRNTARLVIRMQRAGWYWRVRDTIIDFSCLLIRSTAGFVIRMQHWVGSNLSRASFIQ